jgi:phosphatidylglycerophosphate synthase
MGFLRSFCLNRENRHATAKVPSSRAYFGRSSPLGALSPTGRGAIFRPRRKGRPTLLDARLRPLIDPPLDRIGRGLARRGVSPDAVTLAGLGFGLAAGAAIWAGVFWLALVLVAASRLADGLDGAVARASERTDLGGYLDIVADFAFYAAVPLGFVLHDPETNGVAGAVLLAAFYVNGAGFLGFALMAEKRGLETRAQGLKSLYYSAGLLEGTETILFFVAICLVPGAFPALAWFFAALTAITTLGRLLLARRVFRG